MFTLLVNQEFESELPVLWMLYTVSKKKKKTSNLKY
jgi:hypothetical protein